MPHFTLVLEDGTSLGAVELGRPDWRPARSSTGGGDGSDLRVIDKVVNPDAEMFSVLVVEPVQ